jgi:hypothetical protein
MAQTLDDMSDEFTRMIMADAKANIGAGHRMVTMIRPVWWG